jgi:cell division protease FtsH
MKKKLKTFLIWVLLLVLFFIVYARLTDRAPPAAFKEFAAFQEEARSGRVAGVEMGGDGILKVALRDGESYITVGNLDGDVLEALSAHHSAVRWPGEGGKGFSLWPVLLAVGVIALLVFLFLKRMGKGQWMSFTSFTKSKARVLPESRVCTFADVGGCTEAKESLLDLADFLKNPKRWKLAGARLPRGVLLEGPPGCGKTLLSRALAGEAKAKFFFLSASEFVELFVGVGAARVRDTFEVAVKEAPSVLFIDELDAVARHRGSGIGGSHDEREQTLNQLLVCLDSLQAHEQVAVLAATNRSDILDTALLRPGRFDRRIHIGRPALQQRLEVFRIHTRGKPLAPGLSLESLAEKTEGLNGAEIEAIANEAAILAVRRARAQGSEAPVIEAGDFQRALDELKRRGGSFDSLDALLIGSSSQVLEPTGRAVARLVLVDGSVVCGDLLWANAEFVKVRLDGEGSDKVLPKSQVKTLEAVEGTTAARAEEVEKDPWAARPPGVA